MNQQLKYLTITTIDIIEDIVLLGIRHKKVVAYFLVSLVLSFVIFSFIFTQNNNKIISNEVYTYSSASILADGYPQVITGENAKKMLMFDATAFKFTSPVSSSEVTSDYGNRVHPVTKDKSFHAGIDIKASEGDPITLPYRSSEAYTTIVDYVGYNPVAGNYVQLRITAPNKTVIYLLYAHLMQSSNLKLGSEVKVGDIVGYVGSTGSSSGPHLHIAARKLELEDDMSVTLERVNPSYVFKKLINVNALDEFE